MLYYLALWQQLLPQPPKKATVVGKDLLVDKKVIIQVSSMFEAAVLTSDQCAIYSSSGAQSILELVLILCFDKRGF